MDWTLFFGTCLVICVYTFVIDYTGSLAGRVFI